MGPHDRANEKELEIILQRNRHKKKDASDIISPQLERDPWEFRRFSKPCPCPPLAMPLVDMIFASKDEEGIIKMLADMDMMRSHRTAAPWTIKNQHAYLEAARPVDGYIPLHAAAMQNFARLTQQLVLGGARLDLPDTRGRTPLMLATEQGNVEAVKVLLRMRAAHDSVDASGKQPLHFAAHNSNSNEIIKLLVQRHANIDARDHCGITPLMLAASKDSANSAQTFMNVGASKLDFDRFDRSSLDHSFAPRLLSRKQPMSEPIDRPSDRTSLAEGQCPPSLSSRCITKDALLHMSATRIATHPRWDALGDTHLRRLLLFEERTWRRQAVPLLDSAMRDRLHSSTRQLS